MTTVVESECMVIGLTGGIASGKSTVSGFFARCGAVVVDADAIAHRVMARGMPAWQAVVDHFGEAILDGRGGIDRERLGEVVFNDVRQKERLEVIVHPFVFEAMAREVAAAEKRQPGVLVVLDVPLLLETGMREGLDEIVVVYVPESVQIQRLTARDGLTEPQARARVAAQMPIEQKRQLADVVIDNTGSLDKTRRQVQAYYRRKTRYM